MSQSKLYGRHAVLEALRAGGGGIERILLARGGHGPVFHQLQNEAQARRIPVETLDRRRFEKLAGPVVHQGVLALCTAKRYADLTDLIAKTAAHPREALVVVADEIEDPRNLGAIARCADAAGADGLVIPSRRSAEITPVADKASAGAASHLTVARVGNLAIALRELKEAGLWIAGLDAEEGQDLWEADLARPLALVVGGEGKGMRRLTRDLCDLRVKAPMRGRVRSLNAAVAAGVVLYEVLRQRRLGPGAQTGAVMEEDTPL